jgi:hypothetical protein
MRDLGDPSSSDTAGTAVLARRIEQLARVGVDAYMPLAVQLQEPLQGLLDTDTAFLLRAVQDLHHAVGDAQWREPLPRWLRWFGPARNSGLRFQADCREAVSCQLRVDERAQQLAQWQQAQAAESATDLDRLLDAADRLGAGVDQAQALLATLWEGLKPQRPDPADPGRLDKLRALLAQVDEHRALLQRLDLARNGSRDVVRLGRAVLEARGQVLGMVDGAFAAAWNDWRSQVQPLLSDGVQRAQLGAAAHEAADTRRGLLRAMEQLRGACTRLQIDEQALAHALTQLREQLMALLPHDSAGQAGTGFLPHSGR